MQREIPGHDRNKVDLRLGLGFSGWVSDMDGTQARYDSRNPDKRIKMVNDDAWGLEILRPKCQAFELHSRASCIRCRQAVRTCICTSP
jgi:hypothetical protein